MAGGVCDRHVLSSFSWHMDQQELGSSVRKAQHLEPSVIALSAGPQSCGATRVLVRQRRPRGFKPASSSRGAPQPLPRCRYVLPDPTVEPVVAARARHRYRNGRSPFETHAGYCQPNALGAAQPHLLRLKDGKPKAPLV